MQWEVPGQMKARSSAAVPEELYGGGEDYAQPVESADVNMAEALCPPGA